MTAIVYLLILGLIGAGVLAVWKSGSNSAKLKQADQNVEAAIAVANAVSKSPTTHEQLIDELQRPDGKL